MEMKHGISKSKREISIKSHNTYYGGGCWGTCNEYVLYCDNLEILKLREIDFDDLEKPKQIILETFEKMLLI